MGWVNQYVGNIHLPSEVWPVAAETKEGLPLPKFTKQIFPSSEYAEADEQLREIQVEVMPLLLDNHHGYCFETSARSPYSSKRIPVNVYDLVFDRNYRNTHLRVYDSFRMLSEPELKYKSSDKYPCNTMEKSLSFQRERGLTTPSPRQYKNFMRVMQDFTAFVLLESAK